MGKCQKCNANVPDGAQFCPSCGAKYTDVNRCPSCGQELSPNAKFCIKCGTRIDGTQRTSDDNSSKSQQKVIVGSIAALAIFIGIIIYYSATHEDQPNEVTEKVDSLTMSLDSAAIEIEAERTSPIKNYTYESSDYMLFDVYGKVKSVRYSGDLKYTVINLLGIDDSTIKFSSSGQWNNVMDCYDFNWEEENIVPSEVIERDGKGRIIKMNFDYDLHAIPEITYKGNAVSMIQANGLVGYDVLELNLSDGVKEGDMGSVEFSTIFYGHDDDGEDTKLSVTNNSIDSHGNWTSRTYKSSKGSVNVSRSITYYESNTNGSTHSSIASSDGNLTLREKELLEENKKLCEEWARYNKALQKAMNEFDYNYKHGYQVVQPFSDMQFCVNKLSEIANSMSRIDPGSGEPFKKQAEKYKDALEYCREHSGYYR